MRKHVISAMAIVALMLGSFAMPKAQAQVFLTNEDYYTNGRASEEGEELPNIPFLDITYDQYAPLGGGVLLLTALGGAYLVGKRKSKK